MKSSPVNLNKARKEKARDRAKSQADANSAKFGRSKAQRDLQAQRAEKLRAAIEAHRVDKPDEDGAR